MLKNKNYSSTWETFWRLWPMITPFKSGLIVASITLILNAISDALMLSLFKPLLDDGFGKANQDVFIWMPLALVGLMGIRGVSSFVSTYCIAWVSGKVVMKIRRMLFSHIMHMPVSFFTQQSTGKLVSKITYDANQVATLASGALIIVIREGASIIGLCTMMFYYSWQLSLILVVIAPVVSITIKFVSYRFRKISKNMQNAMGQLTSNTEQMLQGHKEVLMFGAQNLEKDKFKDVSNCMRQHSLKMIQTASIFDPLIQFIASLALACVLYAASIPSIMNMLTAGTITVIFSSMIVLMKPLKSLTNVNSQFQRGMAACQTLFSILDLKQEIDQGILEIKKIKGNIFFDNVTFFYPDQNIPSLSNITLTIQSGKIVALVGRSGSGKSTIVNLLTRFYNVHKGKILLDGYNLSDYKLTTLRKQIAIVSQNVYLFNDTIANNIAYACNNVFSRSAIEKAAHMAYVTNFVSSMKNGLDTIIGENGILLSYGQRQRIAIARALLRDCPILIFDEATSALDFESEYFIQQSFNKLKKKNKTLLIITHRLSTIENADEIFVIDNGHIMEHGVHKFLIQHHNIYNQLYKLQYS